MPLFDRKDKSRYATFTRRTLMVSGGMTAVFGVLAGRLYQLQILRRRRVHDARRKTTASARAWSRRCAGVSSTASASSSPTTAATIAC